MDSILSSVKNLLGIPEDDTFFDNTLIIHINSVFSVLNQIGCGPSSGYAITDDGNTWDEFLQNDPEKLQLVKTYMAMKVRQLFDPPQSSVIGQALDRQVAELEWRINVQVDPAHQDILNNED